MMPPPRIQTPGAAVLVTLLFLFLLSPVESSAQIISPGRLTEAHENLEGIRNCTSCHVLGERGISNEKCLECHTPIAVRIREQRGFHAELVQDNCATCHKEHFGRDFDAVRLDTSRFDHAQTGYTLVGRHAELGCESCHTPSLVAAGDVRIFSQRHGASLEDTYLGLGTTCISCHAPDDPHQDQFIDRACADCHDQDAWEDADLFDHNDARFALEGAHKSVSCEGCHAEAASAGGATFTRFVGLQFETCASCHDDPHAGSMGAECSSCHSSTGWRQLNLNFVEDRFDHGRTGFDLEGRHAEIACGSCHGKPARRDAEIAISFLSGSPGATYPRPVAEGCASCHVDYHEGAFDTQTCSSCHGQDEWLPASYDIERHNLASNFELTGAHLATPCTACHSNPDLGQEVPTFRFSSSSCETCHEADNPHGDQFAAAAEVTTCDDCHTTTTWADVASFDHENTDFPLLGRHETVACSDCHTQQAVQGHAQFRDLSTVCVDCHGDDDPHQGQFSDVSCSSCHDSTSFRIAEFDHAGTSFSLRGAHEDVPCASCHQPDESPAGLTFIRFRPLGSECSDCHSSLR